MWKQYRKNFAGMQSLMFIVSAVIYMRSHLLTQALVFFAIMQLGSLSGAMWAARIKSRAATLPSCGL